MVDRTIEIDKQNKQKAKQTNKKQRKPLQCGKILWSWVEREK